MAAHSLDFSDIEEKYAISMPKTFENIVLIDRIPKVDQSKEEKLLKVIKKIFDNVGKIKENGIYMPKDPETGKSKGFLFMQFTTAEEAKQAILLGNGYAMDKKHILSVVAFDDIEAILDMPELYEEPEIPEFQPKEHLKSWLSDRRARDQFSILKGDEVGIYWNNKAELPDQVQIRSNWSDGHVMWSSQGSFFVTIHFKGVALWGGPSWGKIMRFIHPNVDLVDFSPNEKYLVTWSHEPFQSPEGQMHNTCVWDVMTGEMLRSFPSVATRKDKSSSKSLGAPVSNIDWPLLKWSYDDKYVARMTPGAEGVLYVYEAPSMGLINKKSIKIENLMDFCWSPTENMISYWTPELGNIPARATLINIPNRDIVRTKNFFGVQSCKLFWQPSGDYFLVRVDRSKSKTVTVTSLEVFRMREKDIPVDVVELKATEELVALHFEPKGNKFATIIIANSNPYVSFYEVQSSSAAVSGTAAVKILTRLEAKGINSIKWSPKGRFCVLYGGRGSSGELQFWDVDDLTRLSTQEHYNCTDVYWDPSGRYVVSFVSAWHHQNDNGLSVWTVAGHELAKQNIPGLKQFLWRPRPKPILPLAAQKKIKKNLKVYAKEFDEEDLLMSNKASNEVQERRKEQLASYRSLMAKFERWKDEEKEERVELYGFDPYAKEDEKDASEK